MSQAGPQVVAFRCEWFDKQASLVHTFRLNHFRDGTIELMNLKTGKTFLKRTFFPDINRDSLFIGAAVTINCRQLHLIEYADEGTKVYYGINSHRVFGLIKPEAYEDSQQGYELITKIQSMFSNINKLKQIEIKGTFTERFSCSRGYGIAFEANVDGGETSSQWIALTTEQPALFYGSIDDFASEDSNLCFDSSSSTSSAGAMSATMSMKITQNRDNCTACIVKPHIIKSGQLGSVLKMIQNDSSSMFKIQEMEMFHFDKDGVTQFFDVYKGLFTYYENMIQHLIEGPCVFIKLSSSSSNVVEDFRELCGPSDVEVAKHLRPQSIRAQLGLNRVMNAVHCTDLPEDGNLECSYMDKILHL
jgi:nucleoside-diphosphate kinase